MPRVQLDLLVVGEINADLVVSGRDVEPEFGQVEKLVDRATLAVGSSSAITACAAARLGLRTAFAGVVGDDAIGRFMLDAMAARGVDVSACSVDPEADTGVSVLLVDATGTRGRAILTAPGAMTALRAADVDRALVAGARHVHCGGYFLQPGLHAGLAELLRGARSSSLDPNWDPSGRWDSGVHDVIAACDLFLPNEVELRHVTGAETVGAALAQLARPGLTVAVKRGSDGGVLQRGEDRVEVAAPPVDVVDSTGAGDAFDAGLIHAHLAGSTPERQLALAVACGSLATRALGGVEAQPALAEALDLAASQETDGSRT
jgi:sugar/nucleoside kinase (ribokinase family)